MSEDTIPNEKVEFYHEKLRKDAESGGYHLNSDREFTTDLARSLLINEQRYGYQVCPCRLATGQKDTDLDIICPCDYRDADLAEYGCCYCALYVSDDILSGKQTIRPIPERRNPNNHNPSPSPSLSAGDLAFPVWRCKVCGYLCARNEPPLVCPVCKSKQDRFERFL